MSILLVPRIMNRQMWLIPVEVVVVNSWEQRSEKMYEGQIIESHPFHDKEFNSSF